MSAPSLDLIQGANHLLSRDAKSIAHRRGAAFLARQSIESALRDALGVADAPRMRWASRFLVLGSLRRDVEADRGRLIWERWSEVCHYHCYDLVPSADVLKDRLTETAEWIAHLAKACGDD